MSKFFFAGRRKPHLPVSAVLLATLFLVGWMSPTFAQSTTTKPAPAKSAGKKSSAKAGSSIVVGQSFPAVKLKDQTGETFDLSAALKKGPVALVIFRSADW